MDDSIYEPGEDSYLLKKHIKDYKFKNALDVGCGSGIISKELSKYGTVTGIDLNEKAIEFCKKENINGDFIVSDLFSNIKGRFDLITFNAPYLPQDENINDIALYGGKEGYEVIERFLNSVNKYLNENGKILLIFTSLSKPDKIKKIIEKNKLKYKLIDKEHYFFEDIFLYEIY